MVNDWMAGRQSIVDRRSGYCVMVTIKVSYVCDKVRYILCRYHWRDVSSRPRNQRHRHFHPPEDDLKQISYSFIITLLLLRYLLFMLLLIFIFNFFSTNLFIQYYHYLLLFAFKYYLHNCLFVYLFSFYVYFAFGSNLQHTRSFRKKKTGRK